MRRNGVQSLSSWVAGRVLSRRYWSTVSRKVSKTKHKVTDEKAVNIVVYTNLIQIRSFISFPYIVATYRKLGNRLKTLQVNLSLALKNPKDRHVKVSVTDSVKLSRWMIATFFVNTYFWQNCLKQFLIISVENL